MKRSPDDHEPDMPQPRNEQAKNVAIEESEIDQILADSFPASDAPPWTLGVASAPPKNTRKRKR